MKRMRTKDHLRVKRVLVKSALNLEFTLNPKVIMIDFEIASSKSV